MAETPAALATGSVFQGRYEIVRCIAEGGMGAVYEVVHRDTNRHRALKVMLPGTADDEELRIRFEREATVAAGIDSEHIAETIDAGVDRATGTPFIVMELLKGEELGEMLERLGTVPPDDVITYLWQASLALDKTHAAGIVHRDLKPENLFVTRRDDDTPCVKLLDFGIAKVVGGEALARSTHGVVGTPLYVSPEQVQGKPVSAQSDIYALAQIAYTLLTGQPYWSVEKDRADGMFPLLMAIVEGLPQQATARALERCGVELPSGFDAWFKTATATDPADRFESCALMVDALASALQSPMPRTATMDSMPVMSGLAPESGTKGDSATSDAASQSIAVGGPSRTTLGLVAVVALVLAAASWWMLSGDAQVEHPPAAPRAGTTPVPRVTASGSAAQTPSAGGSGSVPSAEPSAEPSTSATTSVPSKADVRPQRTGVPRPERPPKPPPTSTGWTPPVIER